MQSYPAFPFSFFSSPTLQIRYIIMKVYDTYIKYMKSDKSQKSYILKMWLWRIKRNLPKNTVFVARSVVAIKTEGMNNLKW